MSKTLEKILEDELFKTEKLEGLGSLSIKNTSKDTKMQVGIEGHSTQDGEPSLENKIDIESPGDNGNINLSIYNKNILKINDQSAFGIAYHDANKITIKNPTNYLYCQNNFAEIRNFVKGKNVTISTKVNGTVESGNNPSFIISTNKNSYRYQYNITAKNSPFKDAMYVQTIQMGEDEYFTFCQIYTSGAICDLELEIQMEINEQSTDIVKHEEQNTTIPVQKPFRAVKDYKDIFIKQNEKWYEKHIIRRITFTGNENWQYYSGYNYFYLKNLSGLLEKNTTQRINFMSNMFSDLDLDNIVSPWAYPQYNSSQIAYLKHLDEYGTSELDIRLPECEGDVAAFKTKLQELNNAGTPLYFDYIADEPELIECTPEQTKILNKLQRMLSYEDVTNIICTDEIECNLKVIAKTSRIKKLEEQIINARIGE